MNLPLRGRPALALALSSALASVLLFAWPWFSAVDTAPPQRIEKITLATPPFPLSALIFIARNQGFFTEQGLEVVLQQTNLGREGFASVLNGKAEFTAMADTALAASLLAGDPAAVVATIARTDQELTIIARRETGIVRPADLRDKTVSVPPLTAREFYLRTALLRAGVPFSSVRVVHLSPQEEVAGLRAGTVDAAVHFRASWMRQKVTDVDVIDLSPLGYMLHWNIVSTPEYLSRHPETADKLVRGLLQAEQFAREHPDEAIAIVAAATDYPPAELAKAWNGYRFSAELSQALLVTLEDQARWIGQREGRRGPLPDLLSSFYLASLKKANPRAIKVIR